MSFRKDIMARFKSSRRPHRVHYNPDSLWAYELHASGHAKTRKPVEIDLLLPHFRATNQPKDHPLRMYIGNHHAPIHAKIVSLVMCIFASTPADRLLQCRTVSRTKFLLEINGGSSDVVCYLPSDFKGHIMFSGRAAFSYAFKDLVRPHCSFNEVVPNKHHGDVVVINTRGNITFKIWDIESGSAEPDNAHRATSAYNRRSPSPQEWDFLLDG